MKKTAKILIIAATLAPAAAMVPSVAFAWPWSTDMMNQPNIKPQEGVPAPFPKRSVPVTGIPTKVKDRAASLDLKNPVPVTEASIKKGRDLFQIICSACHGLSGKADSPVSEKIGAVDLTAEYIQNYPDGHIWGTITFGSAIMPAYGVPNSEGGSNDLTVDERWHVVNYLKHQLMKEPASVTTYSTY